MAELVTMVVQVLVFVSSRCARSYLVLVSVVLSFHGIIISIIIIIMSFLVSIVYVLCLFTCLLFLPCQCPITFAVCTVNVRL